MEDHALLSEVRVGLFKVLYDVLVGLQVGLVVLTHLDLRAQGSAGGLQPFDLDLVVLILDVLAVQLLNDINRCGTSGLPLGRHVALSCSSIVCKSAIG